MKDKEIKLEEIEGSHTLGDSGEGRVQGRGKWSEFRYYAGVLEAWSRISTFYRVR